MKTLVDTSILVALKGVDRTRLLESQRALQILDAQGVSLCICAQVIMEYWAVATRPVSARGGLGLTTSQADTDIQAFVDQFELLPDTESLLQVWRDIARNYSVSGRQAWDARIAALMQIHSVNTLLTYNHLDFQRYNFITPLTPGEIYDSVSNLG
ncbi:MAG: PIN domain-containing protein [Fimbriimonadales bacterium]|nr:PIN domain-containing protein [Fimbriimonadales bacterium]